MTVIYVFVALLALGYHIWSVKTNPANSGETGIVLLPFCMPWIAIIPRPLLSFITDHAPLNGYLLFVGLNAAIVYALTRLFSRAPRP